MKQKCAKNPENGQNAQKCCKGTLLEVQHGYRPREKHVARKRLQNSEKVKTYVFFPPFPPDFRIFVAIWCLLTISSIPIFWHIIFIMNIHFSQTFRKKNVQTKNSGQSQHKGQLCTKNCQPFWQKKKFATLRKNAHFRGFSH